MLELQDDYPSGWCPWQHCLSSLQSLGVVLNGSGDSNPICISDSEDAPAQPSSSAQDLRLGAQHLSREGSSGSLGLSHQGSQDESMPSMSRLQSRRFSTTGSSISRSSFSRQPSEPSLQLQHTSESSTAEKNSDTIVAPQRSMVDQLLQYHTSPDILEELSKEDLMQILRSASAVLCQRTDRVQALQAANKKLKRQATQYERDLDTVKEITGATSNSQALKKLKIWSLNKKSTLELETRGKTNARLTAQSVLAVGLRRNFSNIAACDFGSTVLFPLSHQTVTRCEVRACSSLKAAFTAFVLEKFHMCTVLNEACKERAGTTGSHTLMTVAIRSDATNTNIWRRQKLHLCECTVGYSCYIDDDMHLATGLTSMSLQQRRLLTLGSLKLTIESFESYVFHIFF